MKKERNELLREYSASHPDHSYAKLGKIFNISRQRVEVIVKQIKPGIRIGKD